ncbi:MAG TPA: TCR/Tet family MFS transporter [Devosiaceae bacterium]|nr:TCR/Tet family MFS transporter [Devosiaceae bacterium]
MPTATNSRLALIFILITVLIDVIGVGIIIPVLPHLIQELIALRPNTDGTIAQAAVWGGWLLFVYAAMQFLFSPVLGNLSDRFGRRPILLLSLLGLTLDYILMGYAFTIWLLFLGRILSGIMGAAISTATAYIADISKREVRARNFGYIGAAVGVGFILGPVIGGQLGEFGPRVPFFAAAGLAFANFVYGYFILPESLAKRNRRRFDLKRANPLGTLQQLRGYPIILTFLGALALFSLANQVYPSIWTFFTIERFSWTPAQVGYSLGIFGIMFAVVQGVLVGPTLARLGEIWTSILGLTFAAIGFFGLAYIHTPLGLYVFLVPGALGGLFVPGINGLMANRMSDNQQGELQGGVNAVNSLSSILGPLAATQLFSFFTSSARAPGYFPGVPFFAAGVMILIAIAVLVWVAIQQRRRRDAKALKSAAETGHAGPDP